MYKQFQRKRAKRLLLSNINRQNTEKINTEFKIGEQFVFKAFEMKKNVLILSTVFTCNCSQY